MKRRVKGLKRVLKVRETQKRLQERALQRASNHCSSLENNAQRISRLHAETHESDPVPIADLFSAKMELSDRLLDASHVVAVSVQVARQDFARAERQNFAARAVHDGTERLLQSKLSLLRKMENRRTDMSINILYNIDNYKKKEPRNDWQNDV